MRQVRRASWRYTRRMRIVTTHLGADFDALGAMAGAALLDPGASLVFPGSQETAVRRFLATERVHLPEVRLRDLRRARLESALVVDCSSLRRLGEVGEIIVEAGCPVQVIDHHPEPEDPIPGADIVTAPVASTCTVMVEELTRREIAVDPMTASLLLLGIYEDTGGLTFADTTATDLRAAAAMVEAGARLEWVRRYALRPLEPEQLALLNQLVEGALEHRVGGVKVVITVARPEERIDEAAYVVHRYAEIFDLQVVIAILELPPQLIVIARSSAPSVDAGRLLAAIGGGGHGTAAAARVRERTAVEVAERLLAEVDAMINSGLTAAVLATPYLYACPQHLTVAEAKDRLIRLKINAMPVRRGGRLVGVVTRQVLDNAIAHGMGGREVPTVMRPGVPEVGPDASVEEVERLFMETQSRLVVVRLGRGWGVITRMDLFRRLYQRQLDEGRRVDRRLSGTRTVVHDVGHRLRRGLTPRMLDVLAEAGEVAAGLGMRAYLVGGAVRDVLLGRPVEDVDIVVEGNGVAVAEGLVDRLGGRCHPHAPFLTAAVRLDDGTTLDVATARTEFYRSPAALPEVESSAIRLDLYRRDFTINAMAIALHGTRLGDLIDFFGGQRDVERRQIRVLHSLSFLDDPTRAIRAVRFATRLSFEIAAETRQLIRVAVREGVFDRLSGTRLREELALLLDESNAVGAVAELDRLGLLTTVLPGVRWTASMRRTLQELEAMLTWAELEGIVFGRRWVAFVTALVARAGEDVGRRLAGRLALSGRVAATVRQAHSKVERIMAVAASSRRRPSEVLAVVEQSEPVVRLVAMAAAPVAARRTLHRALTEWMRVEVPVTGADLVAAGAVPGPALGEALRRTRAALVDGSIAPPDALAHALGVVAEEVSR